MIFRIYLIFFNLVFARACLQKFFDIRVSSHQAFQRWDESLKKLRNGQKSNKFFKFSHFKIKFLKDVYKI